MKKALIISILSFATLNVMAQSANKQVKVNNDVCRTDPGMPANAVAVWPKSDYTPTQDAACAPCYQYRNIHGLTVMECPFLIFPSENSNTLPETGAVILQTAGDEQMEVKADNTYTGNYPACKRNPSMPANAKLVWPKSAYTPVGNPICAPCYEYTNKRGLTIMECPDLVFAPEHKE